MSTLVKRTVQTLAAGAAMSLAAACGSDGGATDRDTAGGGDAWDAVRLAALDEVEGYHDVLAMRDAADLVVVGSFAGFERGREITIPDGLGEGEDDVLVWVDGQLVIEEILHVADYMQPLEEVLADGVLSEDGVLTVEFFAGGVEVTEQIDAGVAQMNAELVDTGAGDRDERAVLFLRMNGGPGEPEPYDNPDDLSGLQGARAAAEVCEITVDRQIMDGLAEGEVFDPARHYPGFDQARHGSCLFRLPDEGQVGPDFRPAQGDTDDLGLLRLVWSYGLITGTAEHPVDAPLGEQPEEELPAVAQNEVTDPRDQWNTLAEFIDYVRTG